MARTSKRSEVAMYDFSCFRSLRKREGLTIGAVSQRSGVSAAVISKLERNQTVAGLETLFRLARVFGVRAADLLALAEKRTAQRAIAKKRTSGQFTFQEISYGNVQLLFGEASQGAHVSRPEIHQDDYEICWVVQGRVRFKLPREQHILNAGEAIQFDALLHHTYEALADCRLIILHLRKGNRF